MSGASTTERLDSEAEASGAPERGRPWVRAGVVLAALVFVGLLAYGVLAEAPDSTIDDRLLHGEAAPAPGFELPLLTAGEPGDELDGLFGEASADGSVALAELRGTPVVVNFWASWCDPCRAEAEVLEDGWRAARDAGVLFVGLDMQDLSDDARAFIERHDTTYPNVRDESNDVALDWGVTGLPETFFVSAEGEVVAHAIGELSAEQLARGVDAARAGRPTPVLEGGDRRQVP